MRNTHWSWLSLGVALCLGLPTVLPAQTIHLRRGHIIIRPEPDEAGDNRSHRPLGDAGDLGQAEEQLAQRLLKARELGQLEEMARKLAQNPKLLADLNKLSPTQLADLRQRLQRGENVADDPVVRRLLERAGGKGGLDPGQRALLEKLIGQGTGGAKIDVPLPPPGTLPPNLSLDPPGAGGPGPRPGPTPPPGQPSPWSHLQDKYASAFREQVQDLVQRLGEERGAAGADLWRRVLERARSGGGPLFPEGMNGMPRFLPERLFPDQLRSALGRLSLPHLPRPSWDRVPSFSMTARPSVPSSGPGWVWLLVLAATGVLLWKALGWQQARLAGAGADGWQIGPWPVAPAAVATRAELIRAFEYLALRCLGPAARTRNHLDLAGDLAGQPDADPGRRRQAADHLARLYEQARYAPVDGPLPEADLAAARRALCYLAGVSAA